MSTTSDGSSKYLRPHKSMQFHLRVCYVRKQKVMDGKQAESLDQEKKENRSFLLLLFRHWIAKNFLLCVNLPPVSVMTLWLSSSPFRYRAVAWLSLSRSLKLIIQMWGKSIRRDKRQITRIGAFCVASTTIYDKNSVFQFSLCKFFPDSCVSMCQSDLM